MASRTEIVVQEPPRSHSAADVRPSPFLVRTSQFLKKVSNLRGARRKSGDSKQFAAGERTTRSMDYGSKDIAMLSSEHNAIPMDRDMATPSPNGNSSEDGPVSVPRHRATLTDPGNESTTFAPQSSMETGHSRAVSDSVSSGPRSHGLVQAPTVKVTNEPQEPSQTHSHLAEDRRLLESESSRRTSTVIAHPPSEPTLNGASVTSAGENASLAESQSLPLRTVSLTASASHLSSDGAGPSRAPSAPSPGELSRSLSDRRNLAPRLATLPPPMMASYTAKGSARLTPSIGPRQAPMPILNLPMLPPIAPSQPTRPRQQAPLRSIPALPMRGPSESEQEADHDNAMLEEDEDEDEDDADGSPGAHEASDEDAEDTSELSSPDAHSDRTPGLPQIDAVRFSGRTEAVEQTRETLYFTPRADAVSTPLVRRPGSSSSAATDYFTSKRAEKEKDAGQRSHSPSRTPRPADYFVGPPLRTPALGNGPQIAPLPTGTPRPGLYHLGSRSMVDLLSASKRTLAIGPENTSERRRSKALPGPPTIEEDGHGHAEPSEDMSPASPTLRRQRSLPMYKVSSDPPPYPSFHPRGGPAVQPRDEEGMERLPSYSNAIYLSAVMPRKMEFTAPGVQARDRKWRRVLCVLEGTAFKVYKCPPGAAGVSVLEEWWERKVGVGDITSTNSAAVTQSGIRVSAVRGRGQEGERPGKTEEEEQPAQQEDGESQPPPMQPPPSSRSKLHIAAATLLHPTRASHSHRHANSTSPRSATSANNRLSDSQNAQARPRQSIDMQQEDHSTISVVARASSDERASRHSSNMSASHSRSSVSNTLPTASDSSSSFFSRSRILPGSASSDPVQPGSPRALPEPTQKDLIHAYSLQHAESGLASDYVKRKNVIRVRMEGEQFLLQAQDVASVIDWIEGIQAATNIALDLDERPMPRGPMFPRRRRRRARAVGTVVEGTRSLRIQAEAAPTAD